MDGIRADRREEEKKREKNWANWRDERKRGRGRIKCKRYPVFKGKKQRKREPEKCRRNTTKLKGKSWNGVEYKQKEKGK